ncbi:MAG: hypothetical protein GXP14_01535 [Gammaproteobacteria bacterium]|nr:hypothetical protein [Gammaproteobacteria bacterium]
MALEFSMSSAPPSLNAIKVERERAAKDRATFRGKNIRFLIYFLTILVTYVVTMLIFIIPHLNDPDWGIGSYFLPYLTFVIFVLGNNLHTKYIEKPQKMVDAAIAELQATTQEELLELVGSREYPVEITSYLDNIATHERLPVRAEMNVLQKWMAG